MRILYLLLLFAAPLCAQQTVALVPMPKKLETKEKWYKLPQEVQVATTAESQWAFEALERGFPDRRFTASPPQDAQIHFIVTKDPAANPEGYQLLITENNISIQANAAPGFFYAVQTLVQLNDLANLQGTDLRCLLINDEPKFSWRGMHLDVCRHFFDVSEVKKYLDGMAYYKMNTFHWHLTEDQGWRIEIKKYPLLTEKGAWRNETLIGHWNDQPHQYDNTRYGGFYTQEQIKEIVEYARKRAITIVPEIEMPGHATAALYAYPEYSCENDKPEKVVGLWGVFNGIFVPSEATFAFLEDVLDEVTALFPGKFVHIGGDEAPKEPWLRSPIAQEVMKREGLKTPEELQSYFIHRIEKILTKRNKRLIGWDEILEGGLAPSATVMSWRGESGGIAAARENHDVVMTPGFALYFDHYQGDPSFEPLAIGGLTTLKEVYEYNPVPASLSAADSKHILGAQANVWTEYIPTFSQVEYMVFPRMLALSEVVWSPKEARNWNLFQQRAYWQYSILEKKGINYRVPEPNGSGLNLTSEKSVNASLSAPAFGSEVHFTTDGSLPTDKSQTFDNHPIKINLPPNDTAYLLAITVTPGGRQSSPAKVAYLNTRPLPTVVPPANKKGVNLSVYMDKTTSAKALLGLNPRLVRQNWPAIQFPMAGTENNSPEEQKSLFINEIFKQDPTAMGVPSGYLSLVYEGYVKVPKTGTYTFVLNSDDGSALYIQGHLVVDNDGAHAPTEKTGQVILKKGIHAFKLAYFDGGGGGQLKVGAIGPGNAQMDFHQMLVK